MTARLKLASAGQRLVGGLRQSSDVYLTVVSVYATFCAPGDIIKCLYDELQDTLNHISSSDLQAYPRNLFIFIKGFYNIGIRTCASIVGEKWNCCQDH